MTDPSPLRQTCERCAGTGEMFLGEHFVTRDMAIDAGEPQMEGMSFGHEYGPCPDCNGTGEVDR